MKIAVCISGFLRIFKETYNNHNHHLFSILRQYGDVDFFVHTWDRVDCNSNIEELEKSIKSLWNPVSYVIEPYFEFDTSKYQRHYGRCNNVISMFYKIKQSFNLAQSHDEYDLFVRLRTDHLFLSGPQQGDLTLANKSNTLIFPKSNINTGVNDQFGIGNKKVIENYASTFDNIEKYYNEGLSITPEHIFSHHLNQVSQKIFISNNVCFCDYTYNNTFSSWEDYSNQMKQRHPGIII